MKYLVVLMFALSSVAAFAEHESGGRHAALAVEVTFVNFGAGIDDRSRSSILSFAAEQFDVGGIEIMSQRQTPGREPGAVVCLQFASLEEKTKLEPRVRDLVAAANQAAKADRAFVKTVLNCTGVAPLPNE